MADLTFYQLDVFTRTPLHGNPLAVFPDADGLDAATMQALAREMNLSETTFVTPSGEATARVRFFTPTAEIPLAGHPTIGTWWLLAELDRVPDAPADGAVSVSQETGAGTLPVELTFSAGAVAGAVMTQARPRFLARVDDLDALSRALGTNDAVVADSPAPEVVSTGMPQLMIPIVSHEALSALPSGGAGGELVELLRRYGTDCAMLYVLDVGPGSATAHCRMFAPGLGVPEDPATGSAAGALGAHVVRRGLVEPENGAARIDVRQGDEIGRASAITVTVGIGETDPTDLTVQVGGTAVRIIHGEVTL